MPYNQLTLAHFDNPQHVGCFTPASKDIGCGQISALGQTLQLQIQFADDKKVESARFKANAEPYVIATLSIICGQLSQQSIEQCKNLDFGETIFQLEIPSDKKYCIILVEDVINAAIDDYLQ